MNTRRAYSNRHGSYIMSKTGSFTHGNVEIKVFVHEHQSQLSYQPSAFKILQKRINHSFIFKYRTSDFRFIKI